MQWWVKSVFESAYATVVGQQVVTLIHSVALAAAVGQPIVEPACAVGVVHHVHS